MPSSPEKCIVGTVEAPASGTGPALRCGTRMPRRVLAKLINPNGSSSGRADILQKLRDLSGQFLGPAGQRADGHGPRRCHDGRSEKRSPAVTFLIGMLPALKPIVSRRYAISSSIASPLTSLNQATGPARVSAFHRYPRRLSWLLSPNGALTAQMRQSALRALSSNRFIPRSPLRGSLRDRSSMAARQSFAARWRS